MRAVIQTEFGKPQVLQVVDGVSIPEPFLTEVQVAVRAAGINPVDGKTRQGAAVAPAMGEFPITVGWDVAGVVTKLGAGVNRFVVGDRVYGMPHFPYSCGAYAEYICASSRQLVRIPDSLDFATAAALPLPATTAYQIVVDVGRVESGQKVLVLAAGGTVGSLVVQIAKNLGATVIGTDSGPKLSRLTDFGLDRGIDFTAHEFDDPDLPGGAVTDIDVVIDLVGGEYALRAVRLTKPGGLVIGVPSGQQGGLREAAALAGVRATDMIVEPDYEALEFVSAMIEKGELLVAAPEVYALDDVVAAHERLDSGGPKMVLGVSS